MNDENYKHKQLRHDEQYRRPSVSGGIVVTVTIVLAWIIGSVILGLLIGIEYGLLETGFRIGYEAVRPK